MTIRITRTAGGDPVHEDDGMFTCEVCEEEKPVDQLVPGPADDEPVTGPDNICEECADAELRSQARYWGLVE